MICLENCLNCLLFKAKWFSWSTLTKSIQNTHTQIRTHSSASIYNTFALFWSLPFGQLSCTACRTFELIYFYQSNTQTKPQKVERKHLDISKRNKLFISLCPRNVQMCRSYILILINLPCHFPSKLELELEFADLN